MFFLMFFMVYNRGEMKCSHTDFKGQNKLKNSSFPGGYVVFLRSKNLPEQIWSFLKIKKMRFFRGNGKKNLRYQKG